MRALLPEPVDDPDVHAHYAQDWLVTGGIRVNFVSSVDGAASAGGVSGGLQTPGDNRIFAALRDLADVVLVGASTAVAENYHRPVPRGVRRERRAEHGLPPELRLAVLTRTGGRLTPELRMFADKDAPPPLLLVSERADVSAVADRAEVVVVGEHEPDLRRAQDELAARGLTRVLCEGGPTVFGQAAAAGVVDELCLSVSPLLVGPDATRIVAGDAWPDGPQQLRLRGLLEEDGALFLRLHARSPSP